MKKFKVGDRVKWFNEDDTAIIIEVKNNGGVVVNWDDGYNGCEALDGDFVFLYPGEYEDFLEKIKDRLE